MTATPLERAERRKAWGFALPALVWTGAFFLVPFLYMAAISLWTRQGRELVATWTFQDGQVVDTQEKVVPAGPQVTDFSITKPDGWPAGNYTLQVSKDGMVLQTREFTVG